MKCPHCGGEIALEDRFCPFCGEVNEQSARHSRDMALFQKRYLDTEESVKSKTRRLSQLLPRTIVLVVLLIASFVCLFVGANAESYAYQSKKKAALRNTAASCARLNACLEAGDFIGFDSYMDWYNLSPYSDEAFHSYYYLWLCAGEYAEVVESLEEVFLRRDFDNWRENYYYNGSEFRGVCLWLENFRDALAQAGREETDETNLAYIAEMERSVDGLLMLYFGFDEDELEEFYTLGLNQQSVRLEEVAFGENENG